MIVVLGSSNTDMVVRLDRLPGPGETVLGGDFSMLAGGKGANQAVAAARAGGKVTFLGRIGDDTFGQQALKTLSAEGIDVSGLTQTPEASSGVALIFVSADGENSIAVAPGANSRMTPDDVRRHAGQIGQAKFLLLQLETPLETVAEAAALARSKGVQVILNPAPAQELPDELLACLEFVTPNQGEAEILAGISLRDDESAEKAADILLARGAHNVIITLGAQGVYAATREFRGFVPAFRVQPVDTTAAGDTFNGAFAAALAEGRPVRDAIVFASAAAALSVMREGAQPAIPSREEIDCFLLAQEQSGSTNR